MRLAIVAAPPLALVSAITLGLALRPHRAAPPAPNPRVEFISVEVVLTDPTPSCVDAHQLVVRGHVSGGASHVRLAGPILYTDVATDPSGDFTLRVPVDGNVCDLLPEPASYAFGDDVRYTISFE